MRRQATSEAHTRKTHIDPQLQKAGWHITPHTHGASCEHDTPTAWTEYTITAGRLVGDGRREKPLRADYVLEYRGRLLAVIEAKPTQVYYTEGKTQAMTYAERLDTPYAYCTNGEKISRIDMRTNTPTARETSKFATPQKLWNMAHENAQERTHHMAPAPQAHKAPDASMWKEKFTRIPLKREIRGTLWHARYYQRCAIERTLNAIAEGKKRLLLTLATGTGKTDIAFQIAWKLHAARWNTRNDEGYAPRILFLCDRLLLRAQAYHRFAPFGEDAMVQLDAHALKTKGTVPTGHAVYFAMYQTFRASSNANEEGYEEGTPKENMWYTQYPNNFFDVVIVDECHRGVSTESNWRAILTHFDAAVHIGMTATPKRDENGDTYAYFGEPLYKYSLNQGIADGYLAPFRVVHFETNTDSYTYSTEDTAEGAPLVLGETYDEAYLDRDIEIDAYVKHRMNKILPMIPEGEQAVFFAKNQDHALRIRDEINRVKGNEYYCARVTANEGEAGDTALRHMNDDEKVFPKMLTTSDKLSTGVDMPLLKHIVLLREISSMVKFKQIIGRGTRLAPEGSTEQKDYFTLYDFNNNIDNFRDPEWDGEPITPPPPPVAKTPTRCNVCGQLPSSCESARIRCRQCGSFRPCGCLHNERVITRVQLSKERENALRSSPKVYLYQEVQGNQHMHTMLTLLENYTRGLIAGHAQLRSVWSDVDTRSNFLNTLGNKGMGKMEFQTISDQLALITYDWFDIIGAVVYNQEPLKRDERAQYARHHARGHYHPQMWNFLEHVLHQYEQEGIQTLAKDAIKHTLTLKYNSLHDAEKTIGEPFSTIGESFAQFQKYLYVE